MNYLLIDVNSGDGAWIQEIFQKLKINGLQTAIISSNEQNIPPKSYESLIIYGGSLVMATMQTVPEKNKLFWKNVIPYVQRLNTLKALILVISIDGTDDVSLSQNDMFLLEELNNKFGPNAFTNLGIICVSSRRNNENYDMMKKKQSIRQFLQQTFDITLINIESILIMNKKKLDEGLESLDISPETHKTRLLSIHKNLNRFYKSLLEAQMVPFKTKYARTSFFDQRMYLQDKENEFQIQKQEIEASFRSLFKELSKKQKAISKDIEKEENEIKNRTNQLQQKTEKYNQLMHEKQNRQRSNIQEELQQIMYDQNEIKNRIQDKRDQMSKVFEVQKQKEKKYLTNVQKLRDQYNDLKQQLNLNPLNVSNRAFLTTSFYSSVFEELLSNIKDFLSNNQQGKKQLKQTLIQQLYKKIESIYHDNQDKIGRSDVIYQIYYFSNLANSVLDMSEEEIKDCFGVKSTDDVQNLIKNFSMKKQIDNIKDFKEHIYMASNCPYTNLTVKLYTEDDENSDDKSGVDLTKCTDILKILFNNYKKSIIEFNFKNVPKAEEKKLNMLIYQYKCKDKYGNESLQVQVKINQQLQELTNDAYNGKYDNVQHMIVVCNSEQELEFLKPLKLQSLAVYNLGEQSDKIKNFKLNNVKHLRNLCLQNVSLENLDECHGITHLKTSGCFYKAKIIEKLNKLTVFYSSDDHYKDQKQNKVIQRLFNHAQQLRVVIVQSMVEDNDLLKLTVPPHVAAQLEYLQLTNYDITVKADSNTLLPPMVIWTTGGIRVEEQKDDETKNRLVELLNIVDDYRLDGRLIRALHNDYVQIKQEKNEIEELKQEIKNLQNENYQQQPQNPFDILMNSLFKQGKDGSVKIRSNATNETAMECIEEALNAIENLNRMQQADLMTYE